MFNRAIPLIDRGSSPRMRGAHRTCTVGLQSSRIIPADAGSTSCFIWFVFYDWDHPRGCGEHVEAVTRLGSMMGSSPRMRGARHAGRVVAPGSGIIPADAGSTSYLSEIFWILEDHPRGCGEHTPQVGQFPQYSGSSPRMRGARPPSGATVQGAGIIPADAGSTHCVHYSFSLLMRIIPADAGSTLRNPCNPNNTID